jgi:hypothetical protein
MHPIRRTIEYKAPPPECVVLVPYVHNVPAHNTDALCKGTKNKRSWM